jgi:PadR family transcriptional regulator PadR
MISNLKSQMRKGLLEYCILCIISRDEAYASDILETLKDAQLVVVEGTVYPLLTRMKNDLPVLISAFPANPIHRRDAL